MSLTLTPLAGIVASAACLWGVRRLAKRWQPRRWYHLWLPVGLGFALVQAGTGAVLAMIGGEGWIAAMAYLMVGVITVPVAGVLLIKGLAAAVSDWRREPGARSAGDRMVLGAGVLGLGLLGLSAWLFFA